MLLVAAIEHHARELGRSVMRAVVEKCSGFSSYEAGDHLGEPWADALADRAEEEVADPPRWGHPSRCPNAGSMCNCTGECTRPQTPAASAGSGESSSPEVSDPPAPSGERPTLADLATSAICDVLANHKLVDIMTEDRDDWQRYGCYHEGEDRTHQWLDDYQAWRAHVAPLIYERVRSAATDFAARAAQEAAQNTYPQFRATP